MLKVGSFFSWVSDLIGKDQAKLLRTYIIPNVVHGFLRLFPDKWFDKIFADNTFLWKVIPMLGAFIYMKATNADDASDDTMNEVAREISQNIEIIRLQRQGKNAKVPTPATDEEIKAAVKTMKAILRAERGDIYKLITQLKDIDEISGGKRAAFMELILNLSPAQIKKFVAMDKTKKKELFDYLFPQATEAASVVEAEADLIDKIKNWKVWDSIKTEINEFNDSLAPDFSNETNTPPNTVLDARNYYLSKKQKFNDRKKKPDSEPVLRKPTKYELLKQKEEEAKIK
jgi:hypothetical protein